MATGTMNRLSTAYTGPDVSNYMSTSYLVNKNEHVDVLWREGSFYYIEFEVSAGKVCGYVQASAVTVSGSVTTYNPPDDKIRYPNTDITEAYLGDNSSYQQTEPPQFPLEVKYLGKKVGDYAFLDYKIPGENKRRRAWVEHMKMRETPRTPGDYTDNGAINGDGAKWNWRNPWNGYSAEIDPDGDTYGHLARDICRTDVGDNEPNPTKCIYAIEAGTVVAAQFTQVDTNGNVVVIEHEDEVSNKKYYSYYVHMSSFYVDVGDTVQKHQALGIIGHTGNTEVNHVHLAITRDFYTADIVGYYKVNEVKTRFDTQYENLGYFDYNGNRFYDLAKYLSEGGTSFIVDNYD